MGNDEERLELLRALGVDKNECISHQAPVSLPRFRDVASEAGLRHSQAVPVHAPNCVFDEPFLGHVIDMSSTAFESFFTEDAPVRALLAPAAFDTTGSITQELQAQSSVQPSLPVATPTPLQQLILQGIQSSAKQIVADIGGFCFPERQTGGGAAGDFDGDGWPDLFLTQSRATGSDQQSGGNGILYRNTCGDRDVGACPGFKDVTAESGLATGLASAAGTTNGAAWADIDNDGDLDLVVSTIGGRRHLLFVNHRTSKHRQTGWRGCFAEEGVARGAAVVLEGDTSLTAGTSVAVGDYDGDGYNETVAC